MGYHFKFVVFGLITFSGCTHQLTDLSTSSTVTATPTPAFNWRLTAQWLDSSGNIYIPDTNNCVIRKVDAVSGNINTVAGDNVAGCGYSGDGGLATAAQLNYPLALALDDDDNLYISDSYNNIIRKVDHATQIITTIAGIPLSDVYAGDGGLATAAEMRPPYGLYVDANKNIYIAEGYSYVVRKITHSTGMINTFAGTGNFGPAGEGGLATAADIGWAAGINADRAGNIYIVDVSQAVVRKVTLISGIITTVAGTGSEGSTGDGGDALSAALRLPSSVTFDASDNLYISDTYNRAIRKVDKNTNVMTTFAGTLASSGYTGDGGPATSAQLDRQGAIAFDANGDLLILDSDNYVVRKVSAATGDISTVIGTGVDSFSGDGGPATAATLSRSGGIARDYD